MSTLQESHAVRPFAGPLPEAVVQLPGSKSLTNRMLLLAACSQGTTTLEGALFSRDTRIMAGSLRQLGIEVITDEARGRLTVCGQGGRIPATEASLHYGNAGTAARFLTAFLATRLDGRYLLDGDLAMRQRPMKGLFDALAQLGTRFTWLGEADHFPCRMETAGLNASTIEVDASASSQILSALLQIAPLGTRPLQLRLKGATVSEPFVRMTTALLQRCGQRIEEPSPGLFVFPEPTSPRFPTSTFTIEPDATAATYFMVLPLVCGGSVFLPGLHRDMLQGDIGCVEILRSTGLDLTFTGTGLSCAARIGTAPFQPVRADFNAVSDTFLTVAALAPLLDGETRISGIAHTRHQETDRVAAMANELRRLGQQVDEEEGALTIRPNLTALRARAREARAAGQLLTIQTYEDHRIAMSFGILACHDLLGDRQPWLAIENPACTGKTFPAFFDLLETLRSASANPPPTHP